LDLPETYDQIDVKYWDPVFL